jgi:hypothetical protein
MHHQEQEQPAPLAAPLQMVVVAEPVGTEVEHQADQAVVELPMVKVAVVAHQGKEAMVTHHMVVVDHTNAVAVVEEQAVLHPMDNKAEVHLHNLLQEQQFNMPEAAVAALMDVTRAAVALMLAKDEVAVEHVEPMHLVIPDLAVAVADTHPTAVAVMERPVSLL